MGVAVAIKLISSDVLPSDGCSGTLVGRIWLAGSSPGPRVIAVRDDGLHDLSSLCPTLSDLFDMPDCAARVHAHLGQRLMSLDEALVSGALLAPCDLQALKATGVTFADSLIERVIEERTTGNAQAANELRARMAAAFGGSLRGVRPGSAAAQSAKETLIRDGLWSQYLEVGIGVDPEIFTKAQPMSAVGCGAAVGLDPRSKWSSPEPEIVLAVSSRGAIVGATLGNDMTLRDFEGRSALLLTKAKDNNASCAIGPFVRLFDAGFSLDDVRRATVKLQLSGRDGFVTEGVNSMAEISRDPADLVASTIGPCHQYPDGLMLFLGTMFVPNADRRGPGEGFTHDVGDIVRVASPKLGTLVNVVATCQQAPPWTFGFRALMTSLNERGLL